MLTDLTRVAISSPGMSTPSPPSQTPLRVHNPRLGITLLVTAGFFLTANDAAIKWITETLPVGEIMFLRAAAAIVFIGAYAALFPGLKELRVVSFSGQAARATMMLVSVVCYVSGLQYLQLADQIAAGFTTPFFIALIARPVLGEPVGLHRWLAIIVGFAGAIVLLRPSSTGIQWAILLPLAAALSAAVRDVITRRISVTETTLAMLFYTSLLECAAGLATAPFGGWVWPGYEILALLALATTLFIAAQFLTIEAFRNAQAAVIAPFRYALLIWGTLWGLVIWGHLPDAWTLTGAGIIVGSGLYMYTRETQANR